ncbi:uracil-DNA glycosylase [Flavobacteriaceae bacterium]|nr:uracil-DNA glycosylase [Flavobacteriaceae bacterium]MDA9016134.1 uracil-DNA glycosylase [Flavobacteriaceae bacterium]MDA9572380.1 uracil-DNA glycosylase [Flavobacteriaceae bacterium]MDB3862351.1 uracil-DNA glycosylase [Flavobacteriaceae bacterium]MDC3354351.1 uracil-DNA glycosylase [Flavobacteriaceae bacterium]
MSVQIHPSWEKVLDSEFKSPYFQNLIAFVKEDYEKTTCYPPANLIFKAFDSCPFDEVKVVLLGQDPYHGPGQAHGLCFSVPEGIAHPPSLRNIFKEIESDLKHTVPNSGNLEHWAQQGVFLINATLSVRAHQAGSHQKKGWEKFTDRLIQLLSEEKKGIVFMLWGGYAKQKIKWIDTKKHLVLTSGHPSPLSANRGYWFGNQHFSNANTYLSSAGKKPIDWKL